MRQINSSNQNLLYKHLSIGTLKNLAEKIYSNECPDIKLIEKYITDDVSVLDIGSGYGRAIEYLVNMKRNLSITGVELNAEYYRYLTKRFNNINLINKCILQDSIEGEFDIVLMLWCFIYELSDYEISVLLTKIKKLITPSSYLFIDVLNNGGVPSNATHIKGDVYETNYGGYTNIKKNNDIVKIFNQFGFDFIEKLSYTTTTSLKSILVFRNNKNTNILES